jgi:regulator of replication initiation timing
MSEFIYHLLTAQRLIVDSLFREIDELTLENEELKKQLAHEEHDVGFKGGQDGKVNK